MPLRSALRRLQHCEPGGGGGGGGGGARFFVGLLVGELVGSWVGSAVGGAVGVEVGSAVEQSSFATPLASVGCFSVGKASYSHATVWSSAHPTS